MGKIETAIYVVIGGLLSALWVFLFLHLPSAYCAKRWPDRHTRFTLTSGCEIAVRGHWWPEKWIRPEGT